MSWSTLAYQKPAYKRSNANRVLGAAMRRKSTERPERHEVIPHEIIVGGAWAVLYVVMVAGGLARDAVVLLAERGSTALF